MVRASRFTLLLALSASLTATAGDKEKIVAALIASAEKNAQERKSSEGDNAVAKKLVERARVNEDSASPAQDQGRELRDVRLDLAPDNIRQPSNLDLNVARCPHGSDGWPSYDELRTRYRDYTDNELWKICLRRSEAPFTGGCACALLASPDPWRPVETPQRLEHADLPITDSDDADVGK